MLDLTISSLLIHLLALGVFPILNYKKLHKLKYKLFRRRFVLIFQQEQQLDIVILF